MIDKYKRMMPDIFSAVASAVGSHVMLLVLSRSLWKTKVSYPEAELIEFSEEGISIDKLEGLNAARAELIVNDFVLSIIETLSRLVGIQIAEKLTNGLTDAAGNGDE